MNSAPSHGPRPAARRSATTRLVGCLTLAALGLAALTAQPAAADDQSCTQGADTCDRPSLNLTISDTTVTADPVRSRHDTDTSPVISRRTVEPDGTAETHLKFGEKPKTPWYKTTLGIAGIGAAVTAATLPLDRDINRLAQRHISYSFRKDIPLNIADALTDASLVFAGATMFQSPWSSAKLAHASSVAATATFITTAAVFGLKFAFGRQRPGGPGSSPYEFHPFSSRYDVISGGSIIKLGAGQTASFPSGHTAVAFSIITPYAEIYHEPWLYAIPVTVGISRIIAVDGHWASDVVAGGLLGWLTADLTRRFFPDSDFGVMLFGDRLEMHKSF